MGLHASKLQNQSRPLKKGRNVPLLWGTLAAVVAGLILAVPWLARAEPRSEELRRAIDAYVTSARLNEGDAHIHYDVDRILILPALRSDAAAAYQHAASREDAASTRHTDLAHSLNSFGCGEAASLAFEKGLEFREPQMEDYIDLGMLLRSAGELDQAVQDFTHASSLAPDEEIPRRLLAATYADLGQIEEAVRAQWPVTNSESSHGGDQFTLASYLEQTGRPQDLVEAVKLYEEVPETDSAYRAAQARLRRLRALQLNAPSPYEEYAAQGDFRAEIHSAEQNLAAHLDEPAAYTRLGSAVQYQGQPNRAMFLYRIALQLDPEFAEAHFLLGRALSDKRRYTDAITYLHRALELGLKEWYVYDELGRAYHRQGIASAAIGAYRAGLIRNPISGVSLLAKLEGVLQKATGEDRSRWSSVKLVLLASIPEPNEENLAALRSMSGKTSALAGKADRDRPVAAGIR